MVRKDKISVTLDPTVVGELSDRVGEEYESRSEAVEDLLTTAFTADERKREYEERIAELERERSSGYIANVGNCSKRGRKTKNSSDMSRTNSLGARPVFSPDFDGG